MELIKNTVAKRATDDELKFFLYMAMRMGLDLLTRQMNVRTGVDGYRAMVNGEKSAFYCFGQMERICTFFKHYF